MHPHDRLLPSWLRASWVLGAIVALSVAACTPGSQPAAQGGATPDASSGTSGNNRVVIAIGAEVNTLATKFESGNTYASEYNFLSNSPLVVFDPHGTAQPLLAAELPSQDNGTWVVNPDGTMQTTWKIRPNAKWQDGTPVTPADFVFALRVYMDEAVPIRDRTPEQFMDHIEPMDDHTFVIYWNQTYPWANELSERELEPLPEHIMGSVYDAGDKDAFVNNSFWSSTDYVGEGPFTLVEWVPGTELDYQAFDDYFMGRPKLDEVLFRVISDTNTVVANVLGGQVDATVGITLGQEAGKTVKQQWQDGQVIVTPVRWRYTQIQFDPSYLQQPALADVRVRQAIISAIDRKTLADVVTEGTSGVADVMMAPTDPRYPKVKQAIATYPFDVNRALAQLADAGWTQQGGSLVNSAGDTFALDMRTTEQTDNQTEMSIMASDLSKIGMQVAQTIVPQSRIRDSEYRIEFPGLNNTAQSIDVPTNLLVAISKQCPDPDRKYAGSNRGCWSNADFDRLYRTAMTSLDPTERDDAVVQAFKILTDNVGLMGLSYNSESLAVRNGLVGPGPRWSAQVGDTWNIQDWHWK